MFTPVQRGPVGPGLPPESREGAEQTQLERGGRGQTVGGCRPGKETWPWIARSTNTFPAHGTQVDEPERKILAEYCRRGPWFASLEGCLNLRVSGLLLADTDTAGLFLGNS